MTQPFIYGVSVEGELFTDRESETQRLRMNFEHGVNSILISPRRMGKTSLVRHVAAMVDCRELRVVYMDIYKCRTVADFYEQFAAAIIEQLSTRAEQMLQLARDFIAGISPQVTFSVGSTGRFTLSLGLDRNPARPGDDILNLPERIAERHGIRVVVCVDEFQQIGEFADTLSVQRAIRGAWQHHRRASYCLFGSKKHLMSEMFYTRSMPFFQFGDLFFLPKIPVEKWVEFITRRFRSCGKDIAASLAARIAETARCHSAYVQQIAWNVLTNSAADTVSDSDYAAGLQTTLEQVTPLFIEQTRTLTAYQLNYLRAVCSGFHTDFGRREVTSHFNLGTRSNLPKIEAALTDREIIDRTPSGTDIADPLFEHWFRETMM